MHFAKFDAIVLLAGLLLLGTLAIGCSEQPSDKKDEGKSAAKTTAPNSDTNQTPAPEPMESTQTKSNEQEQNKVAQDSSPAEPIAAEQFPRPNNAEKPMYTAETNTVMFHQEGTVDDQAKFYSEQLDKLGWKKNDSSEIADGVAFLDFNKGGLNITVTINPLREGMITTIAQGNGLVVPESLEENDDDDGGFEDDQ